MKVFLPGILAGVVSLAAGEIRMNEIQAVGTHNSYHLAPDPGMMKMVKMFSKEAEAWEYSHAPLAQQLAGGIRQIELDVFADPKGGLYAESNHPRIEKMKQPGIKVLHVPKLDARSNHDSLVEALTVVRDWSLKNPRHVPIMLLIELKDRKDVPFGPTPVKFDRKQMEVLEKEIWSVFDRKHVIDPDEVRNGAKTLREAVLKQGWPLLNEVRGKVFFCLDNEGGHREVYLEGNQALENRVLFVSVRRDHPAAAFMKRNDPAGRFGEIQKLVRDGFIVRTRADANLVEARANDRTRGGKALESGAQYISTDFPVADRKIGEYEFRLPGKLVARANPVSGGKAGAGELE